MLPTLRRVINDLDELGIKWALVGALAVSVRTEPRTTRDIDIAVAASEEAEVQSLLRQLKARGYENEMLLMHMMPARKLGWRLTVPGSTPPIPLDILVSSCGIEFEIVQSAIKLSILPGLTAPVATLGHLIAMKVLSHDDGERIRDKSDLTRLLSEAQSSDIREAETALLLIDSRGFSRERDLLGILREMTEK